MVDAPNRSARTTGHPDESSTGTALNEEPGDRGETRVLHLGPWDREGGLATYSQYLVNAGRSELEDVVFEVFEWDSESLFVRGTGVKTLSRSLLFGIRDADVVHVQYIFNRYVLSFPMIVLLCHLTGTSIVMTDHNAEYKDLPLTRFFYVYHQCLYFFVDAIVVHSSARAESIWDRHAVKVTTIPHGVIYRDGVERGPRRIRQLLLPGFIRRNKGHDLAVEAMKHLPSEVRLEIAGPIHEMAYVKELERLADRKDVSDRVRWETGFLPEDVLYEKLQDADLVVLPYKKSRPMSGILGHSISWQVPAILTDFPAFRDAVDCDEAFFDPRTPEELAAAVERLDENPDCQRSIIDTFAELSRERSWENTVRRTRNIYTSVT